MLDKLVAESDVHKKPFTVLLLDMDHFRAYNEKHGHLEGDNMLKYFAGTLRAGLESEEALIFRFGGDEFIIVFPEKKAREVYSIARRMINIFRKRPFLLRGRLYKMHFSAGIATYPTDGHIAMEVIHKADKAMYFSKTHGRARATIYSHVLWKTLARIIISVIIISLAVSMYLGRVFHHDHLMGWLKKKIGKIGITFVIPEGNTGEKRSVDLTIIK
jgi:diguanylate cyclase (GGDEF)-like protein